MRKTAFKVIATIIAISLLLLSLVGLSGCGLRKQTSIWDAPPPEHHQKSDSSNEGGKTSIWDLDKNYVNPPDNVGAKGDVIEPDDSIEYR